MGSGEEGKHRLTVLPQCASCPDCPSARHLTSPPRPNGMQLLSVFGIYTSFEKTASHVLSATAVTDCLLYTWSVDELGTMATRMAPAGALPFCCFALQCCCCRYCRPVVPWSCSLCCPFTHPSCLAVGAYWRYFSLCQLGMYFGALSHPDQELVCATGEPELERVREGVQMCTCWE